MFAFLKITILLIAVWTVGSQDVTEPSQNPAPNENESGQQEGRSFSGYGQPMVGGSGYVPPPYYSGSMNYRPPVGYPQQYPHYFHSPYPYYNQPNYYGGFEQYYARNNMK